MDFNLGFNSGQQDWASLLKQIKSEDIMDNLSGVMTLSESL